MVRSKSASPASRKTSRSSAGWLLCQDAFIVGDTAFVRDEDGPEPGGRIYTIGFTATDNRNPALSCAGQATVCQDLRNHGKAYTPIMPSYVSTMCPSKARK